MAALTRVLRLGVALPALALALAAAGCGSSVAGAAGASSPAPSRSLSLSYSVGPFMTPSSGGIVVTPRPSGPVVYLAEGGDPRGTALHAPRCPAGDARRLWARASFAYPNGLPAALSGENAPVNPMIYEEIAAESAKHCA